MDNNEENNAYVRGFNFKVPSSVYRKIYCYQEEDGSLNYSKSFVYINNTLMSFILNGKEEWDDSTDALSTTKIRKMLLRNKREYIRKIIQKYNV